MTGSLGVATVGGILLGIGLYLAPSDRGERWCPRALAVAAAFASLYALQAIWMASFYDGGQGDNRYQLALLDQIQRGNLLGDYFYRSTPAHYPPLFFWAAGGAGKALGLGAEGTLRWMPVAAILASAAGIAYLARRVGSHPAVALVTCFGIGGFAAYYLFSYPPDRGLWWVVVEKPQQLLGGLLCLALPVAVSQLTHRPAMMLTACAVLTAALVLTMPLYLPLAVAAALLWATLSGLQARGFRRTSPPEGPPHETTNGPQTGGGALQTATVVVLGAASGSAVASPYLLPVLEGVLSRRGAGGYLHWQSLASLDVSHWTVGFGFGIPLVAGIAALRPAWNHRDRRLRGAARALVACTALAWMTYLSAFVTYPLFGWSYFSWWMTVPALLGTCLLASVRITDWARRRSHEGALLVSRFSPDSVLKAALAATVAVFGISWNVRTDDFLAYAYSPVDPSFKQAAAMLQERTPEGSSFVGGQEELIVSGLSGRGMVYVPHAFYASPLADSEARKAAVLDLLHRPSCEKVASLEETYGMEAVLLTRGARWIPRVLSSDRVVVEEGAPPIEADDLVLSELVAEKRGDPQRVSKTVLYRASAGLSALPCLELVMDSEGLAMFVVTDPVGGSRAAH